MSVDRRKRGAGSCWWIPLAPEAMRSCNCESPFDRRGQAGCHSEVTDALIGGCEYVEYCRYCQYCQDCHNGHSCHKYHAHQRTRPLILVAAISKGHLHETFASRSSAKILSSVYAPGFKGGGLRVMIPAPRSTTLSNGREALQNSHQTKR